MNLTERLEQIESRRQDRDWQPKQTIAKPSTPCPSALKRALELRDLEITVQEWSIESALDQDNEIIRATLCNHAGDEDKHSQQLGWLAEYWVCTSISPEARTLIQEWQQIEVDPMVKKLCLEAGVFFPILAMMVAYASGDVYTQAIRQWIMSDESAHVASARLFVKEANLKIPSSMVKLVEKTIAWLTQGMSHTEQQRWLKMSSHALRTGQIEDSSGVSTVAVPEPLTQSSRQKIPYQRIR